MSRDLGGRAKNVSLDNYYPPSRRIKIKQKEIDQDIVIKMFEKLKRKVHNANKDGLTTLVKI